MTPEEKEAFRKKVNERLKNKSLQEVVDELCKMCDEVDRGEF